MLVCVIMLEFFFLRFGFLLSFFCLRESFLFVEVKIFVVIFVYMSHMLDFLLFQVRVFILFFCLLESLRSNYAF